jgi:hypothetical protein
MVPAASQAVEGSSSFVAALEIESYQGKYALKEQRRGESR